jgi:hypothetical protein
VGDGRREGGGVVPSEGRGESGEVSFYIPRLRSGGVVG